MQELRKTTLRAVPAQICQGQLRNARTCRTTPPPSYGVLPLGYGRVSHQPATREPVFEGCPAAVQWADAADSPKVPPLAYRLDDRRVPPLPEEGLVRFALAIALPVVAALLQASIVPFIAAGDVRPNLPLLVAASWAVAAGAAEACWWAFVGGIAADVLSGGPLGAFAVASLPAVAGVGLGERAPCAPDPGARRALSSRWRRSSRACSTSRSSPWSGSRCRISRR